MGKPKKGVMPPALASYMAKKSKPKMGSTSTASHLAGPKKKTKSK